MKKINEGFTCIHCKKEVPVAEKTCRNHCTDCFVSLHVDGDMPGDRNTECHGMMYPIMYEIANGETKISFRCIKCDKVHRNKALPDDELGVLDEKIDLYKIKFIQKDNGLEQTSSN